MTSKVQIIRIFKCKIDISFLSCVLGAQKNRLIEKILLSTNNICFGCAILGAQKNRLIEKVLLSTNNICFGCAIRKIVLYYTLLSGDLSDIFH